MSEIVHFRWTIHNADGYNKSSKYEGILDNNCVLVPESREFDEKNHVRDSPLMRIRQRMQVGVDIPSLRIITNNNNFEQHDEIEYYKFALCRVSTVVRVGYIGVCIAITLSFAKT